MRTISRLCWIGLFGSAWLSVIDAAKAWDPPCRIETKFQFKIEIKTGPEIRPPTAPWYAYFPADARTMPNMQTTPYPPWPGQFPPASTPMKEAPKAPTIPLASTAMSTQQWPSNYYYGSTVQPVGYVPAQAPSYWYQSR